MSRDSEQIMLAETDRIVNGRPVSRIWTNTTGYYAGVNPKGYSFNVETGLCVGSADRIGGESILITPEHVGRYIMQFWSIEGKKNAQSKIQPGQRPWRDLIIAMGGAACITHEPDTVLDEMHKFNLGVEAPPDWRVLRPLLEELNDAKKRKK